MKRALTAAGRAVELRDDDLLGEGGEGRVYAWEGRAVKIYHVARPRGSEGAEKIATFPRGLPDAVHGPEEPVLDGRGNVAGFVMRRVRSGFDASRLRNPAFRDPRTGMAGVVAWLRHAEATLGALHARGVVVGDVNDGNVLVCPSSTSAFIDADSMQFGRFACPVAHERFVDPRLYGTRFEDGPAFDPSTDSFAFAVLAFLSLFGVHPYGGIHPKFPTFLRRAEARKSVLGPDVVVPAGATPFAIVPDDVLDHFARVFDGDHRGPLPRSLHDARFVRCTCGLEHARRACPRCVRGVAVPGAVASASLAGPVRPGTVLRTTLFRTPGTVVAARLVNGALVALADEGGVLRREDGTVLRDARRSPGTRVVLTRGRTLLGDGTSVRVFEGARAAATFTTSTFDGLSAFDVPADDDRSFRCHVVDGGYLVDAVGSRRIGPVLPGGTWFRVGTSMGVVLYRTAGRAFVSVFNTARGGLRDVPHASLPVLEGRLVDVDATFDGDLALLTWTTAVRGALVGARILLAKDGSVVAADEAPLATSVAHGPRGRAFAHGALVSFDDDGPTSTGVDAGTRSFGPRVPLPLEPGTVSPECTVFAGPGGSLVVARREEVFRLSLS
ncbi:MAG: hypothetical protein U0169_18635 [Polyangiaceae bacterium]